MKSDFDRCCVFCGTPHHWIEGAHCVPRDYEMAKGVGLALVDVRENIYPMCAYHHKLWDLNGPAIRFIMLYRKCALEYSGKVRSRLRILLHFWSILDNGGSIDE